MTPHTDCPTCPHCGSPCGVPVASRLPDDWAPSDSGADNLACAACGRRWRGTDAEVAQAERAQAAWDAMQGGGW